MRPQPRKATQQQTKAYNSRLVLKTVYDNGLISRADVARATHLTRTSVSDGDDALFVLYELVDEVLGWPRRPVLGISIGTPGLVDSANGVVVRAVNLEWRSLPLGRMLHERYKVPVYVANDSQLAALGI